MWVAYDTVLASETKVEISGASGEDVPFLILEEVEPALLFLSLFLPGMSMSG